MTTLADWKTVPETVAVRMQRAIELRSAYEKLATQTGDLAGTVATWDTVKDALVLYRPGALASRVPQIKEADYVEIRDNRETTPDWEIEILIKKADLPYVGATFDALHNVLGGRTPLANGIVSSLMLGGLGYGAGTLAENLFPERYVERGKLRKNLAIAGALTGAGLGAHNAYANSRRTGNGFFRSMFTPATTQVPIQTTNGVKMGSDFRDFGPVHMDSNSGIYAPTISVPQFNAAAWNDVQRGMYTGGSQFTPPAYAAAATGLMTGISTAQRSPIIRPVDVIHGIASAGVGLATANVAGRALSTLAGLTPAGQEKLQDMGLWGGMMHAIVPSIFSR